MTKILRITTKLERLKKQIVLIKEDETFEKKLKNLQLTNRQIHLVVFIKENKNVKSSDFLKHFKISLATVKRELKVLIEKKVIKKELKGKNTYYYI